MTEQGEIRARIERALSGWGAETWPPKDVERMHAAGNELSYAVSELLETLPIEVPPVARTFPRYMMGTIAYSGGVGPSAHLDISRDEPDLLIARRLDTTLAVYVGEWCTGFGFMEVRFPIETTRDLTPEEIETYRHKVAVATFAPGHWPALEDGIAVGPDA